MRPERIDDDVLDSMEAALDAIAPPGPGKPIVRQVSNAQSDSVPSPTQLEAAGPTLNLVAGCAPSTHGVSSLIPGGLLTRLQRRTGYVDPFRFESKQHFRDVMYEAHIAGASDIFIQPGLPICVEIEGDMYALTTRSLDETEVKFLLKEAVGRDTAITDIISGRAVDGRYELHDPSALDARGAKVRHGFRVNASPILHWAGTAAQIVLRGIPKEPPLYSRIGLTDEIIRFCTPHDGIVYVAGATGSGKTTSFASILRYILENDTPIKGNLITHEQPVEFTYESIVSRHSIIVQSQIPNQFPTFDKANEAAMRRKPGLIMVGELRDEATIRAANEASLTGHPVFGTVHAKTVAAIMRRLISRFPENERATAIYDLVETARFAMAQRLVKGVDGKRIAVREYLVFDEKVREELSSLTDMGRVTSAVKRLVETRGHSFRAEASRLLAERLIDSETAQDIEKAE